VNAVPVPCVLRRPRRSVLLARDDAERLGDRERDDEGQQRWGGSMAAARRSLPSGDQPEEAGGHEKEFGEPQDGVKR